VPYDKIGLVIQGPIYSSGRNFESSSTKVFKSIPYIENYFLESLKLGIEVVLMTWDLEDTSELDSFSKDIYKLRYSRSLFPKFLLNDWSSNKYKQFFLTLKGIEVLENRKCTTIIKVRTDQKLDIQLLATHIKKNPVCVIEKLLTLFGDIRQPDQWVDFVFAGETQFLKEVLQSYLSQKEIFPSVHKDFFYHMFLRYNQCPSSFFTKFFFPYNSKALSDKNLINISRNWRNSFSLMPKRVLEELEWRGSKFNRQLEIENFFGNEDYNDFIDQILELPRSSVSFPRNLLHLDALTLLFSGKLSIQFDRIRNSIIRRLGFK